MEIGTNRQRLVEKWRQCVPVADMFRLEDMMGLLLFLRAWCLRADGVPWARAARLTGVSVDRLRAVARRTVSCKPTEVDAMTPAAVAASVGRLLHPLLQAGRPQDARAEKDAQ